MQKALFPMKYLRCTQDENSTTSHAGSLAMDFGGQSGATDDVLFAPCDMICRRRREDSSHELYFESTAAVECADGYKGIVHFTFMHDNTINSNVKVGQVIKQGEYFMDEGGFGRGVKDKFARHVHIEAGKGASPARQVQNSKGTWVTIPQSHLYDIFFIAADTIMLAGKGNHAWRHTTDKLLDTSANGATAATDIGVGSIVQFTGGNVYGSSTASKATSTREASLCKVTVDSPGTAHPWHLISEDNGGVWGWVNAADIDGAVVEEEAIEPPAGATYMLDIGPASVGDKNYLEAEAKALGLPVEVKTA